MPDERRPVGRPRIDTGDTTTRTSVVLPTREYDRLCKQALRDGISVSEAIRRQLQDDDADDD